MKKGKSKMETSRGKFLLITILALSFFVSQKAIAGPQDNVSGWAWSENVGWISFNSTDTGASVNYGVNVSTSTGKFSGYAWVGGGVDAAGNQVPVLGWISFNRSETEAPPSADPCPSPDDSCIAKLEDGWQTKIGKQNVYVKGWARVLSVVNNPNAGGWDGWIRFDHGQSGEVYIDPQGNFHGWAWSDSPLGWISFNSSDSGPGGASYKVVLDLSGFNRPPTVSAPSATQNPCAWGTTPQVAPGLSITLNWSYSDSDGDPQNGYEIWVDTDSNFSSENPKFKYSVENNSSNSYSLDLSQNNSTNSNKLTYPLNWNTTYYWKVKVKDSKGAWSDWSAVGQFTTPPHAYPYPSFNWIPQRPSVGEVVRFCSVSSTACQTQPSGGWSECFTSTCTWSWTFQNATPSTSNLQNPTTTFTKIDENQVTLRITDSDGFSCEISQKVRVTYPLPKWKEIPPIIYFEKLLANLSQFFSKFKLSLRNFFH